MGTRGAVTLDTAIHGLGEGAWHLRCELDFIEAVAIALEQTDLVAIQPEHLVTIGRLHDAQQRPGMEAVDNHGQLGDRTLQPVDAEEIRAASTANPSSVRFQNRLSFASACNGASNGATSRRGYFWRRD
ncbi:MAG: hypothetical protein ABI389_15050 [Rhodanobacter sp.]